MRFSDAPFVNFCLFVFFFLDFFTFYFFFAGVFWISPLCLPVLAFGNTPTCVLSHSDKDHEKISSLK
jgi:hypothetical protein